MPCVVASHSAFLADPPLLAKGCVHTRPCAKVGCSALETGPVPGAGSACGNVVNVACVNTVEAHPFLVIRSYSTGVHTHILQRSEGGDVERSEAAAPLERSGVLPCSLPAWQYRASPRPAYTVNSGALLSKKGAMMTTTRRVNQHADERENEEEKYQDEEEEEASSPPP